MAGQRLESGHGRGPGDHRVQRDLRHHHRLPPLAHPGAQRAQPPDGSAPRAPTAALWPGWRISGRGPSRVELEGSEAQPLEEQLQRRPGRRRRRPPAAGSDQWPGRASPASSSARRRSSTGRGSPGRNTRPSSKSATSRRPCRTLVSSASSSPGFTSDVRSTRLLVGQRVRQADRGFSSAPARSDEGVADRLGQPRPDQHVADESLLALSGAEAAHARGSAGWWERSCRARGAGRPPRSGPLPERRLPARSGPTPSTRRGRSPPSLEARGR